MAEVDRELVDSGWTKRLELKTEEEDIQEPSEDDNSGTEQNGREKHGTKLRLRLGERTGCF